MSARKRKAEPSVVNNNNNTTNVNQSAQPTLNNFFGPATTYNNAAPAPAPTPEPRWLPPPPPDDSRVSQNLGGALFIRCSKCRGKKIHPVKDFKPDPTKQPRERARYDAALEAYDDAREARDGAAFLAARVALEQDALAKCAPCRVAAVKSKRNPSTKHGACEAEWRAIKERLGGCARCGSERAIEANHRPEFHANTLAYNAMVKTHGVEAAEAQYPPSERKLGCLSRPSDWTGDKGGVEAMRAEEQKVEPLCRMCHALDDSSVQAPQNAADPDALRREDYDSDKQYRKAVWSATQRKKKREFVNAIKRLAGRCERPDCPCDGPSGGRILEDFEPCYDCDHLKESTKEHTISDLVNDGVSFETRRSDILRELGLPLDFDPYTATALPPVATRRCRVLCSNCHVTRKQWDSARR